MKNDKLTLTHLITFLILIIISLLFFAYTNNTIYKFNIVPNIILEITRALL